MPDPTIPTPFITFAVTRDPKSDKARSIAVFEDAEKEGCDFLLNLGDTTSVSNPGNWATMEDAIKHGIKKKYFLTGGHDIHSVEVASNIPEAKPIGGKIQVSDIDDFKRVTGMPPHYCIDKVLPNGERLRIICVCQSSIPAGREWYYTWRDKELYGDWDYVKAQLEKADAEGIEYLFVAGGLSIEDWNATTKRYEPSTLVGDYLTEFAKHGPVVYLDGRSFLPDNKPVRLIKNVWLDLTPPEIRSTVAHEQIRIYPNRVMEIRVRSAFNNTYSAIQRFKFDRSAGILDVTSEPLVAWNPAPIETPPAEPAPVEPPPVVEPPVVEPAEPPVVVTDSGKVIAALQGQLTETQALLDVAMAKIAAVREAIGG